MFEEDDELCENCEYYFGIAIIEVDGEEILVCLGCKDDLS